MLTFSVSNPRPAVNEPVRLEVDPALIAEPEPAWDLGNAVHLRGNPLDYRYDAPGTYRVVLTATESGCYTKSRPCASRPDGLRRRTRTGHGTAA